MRPGLPMEIESGTLGRTVSRPAVGVGGRDKPGHDGAGRDGVATSAGAGKERAMRPGLPMEIESGTLGPTVSRPAVVMTGLVPVTHAAPRVRSGETRPRHPGFASGECLVGVGGRDEPGHDGAGRDGVATNAGASKERAMRPGLPMEIESGTLGPIVSRPAVGVGGRDKPGHDGAGRDGVATNAGASKERAMRPGLPMEIESGTLGPIVSRPAVGVGGRDKPGHDGAGRNGVATNEGAGKERAMRPALPREIESGTLGPAVSRPAVVMTGLVPVTHAAPRVRSGETSPRHPGFASGECLVGVGGRDKPGHDGARRDGVATNAGARR